MNRWWMQSCTDDSMNVRQPAMRRAWIFPLIAAAAMAVSGARAADDAPLREIVVDSSITVGNLRPFSGVNGAPAAEFAGPAASGAQSAAPADIAEFYRAARIDLIRTHDAFGPGDIDARFGAATNLPIKIPAERNALNIFPDM